MAYSVEPDLGFVFDFAGAFALGFAFAADLGFAFAADLGFVVVFDVMTVGVIVAFGLALDFAGLLERVLGAGFSVALGAVVARSIPSMRTLV